MTILEKRESSGDLKDLWKKVRALLLGVVSRLAHQCEYINDSILNSIGIDFGWRYGCHAQLS